MAVGVRHDGGGAVRAHDRRAIAWGKQQVARLVCAAGFGMAEILVTSYAAKQWMKQGSLTGSNVCHWGHLLRHEFPQVSHHS